jgi:hypothetical protein
MHFSQFSSPLALCHALQEAGLWLSLRDQETLVVGPTAVARQHPDLLDQVRVHKPALMAVLRETLAYEVLGAHAGTEGTFTTDICPACQQPSWIITPPRRLAVHRTPDGTAVCPGAIKAQEETAHVLMQAFIVHRCVQRPGSVLTWMALRGGLEGWACQQGLLLPPRPYLIAWMDQHYTRMGKDDTYPLWQGLTFSLEEWLGEDEGDTTPADTLSTPAPRRKVVLTA